MPLCFDHTPQHLHCSANNNRLLFARYEEYAEDFFFVLLVVCLLFSLFRFTVHVHFVLKLKFVCNGFRFFGCMRTPQERYTLPHASWSRSPSCHESCDDYESHFQRPTIVYLWREGFLVDSFWGVFLSCEFWFLSHSCPPSVFSVWEATLWFICSWWSNFSANITFAWFATFKLFRLTICFSLEDAEWISVATCSSEQTNLSCLVVSYGFLQLEKIITMAQKVDSWLQRSCS